MERARARERGTAGDGKFRGFGTMWHTLDAQKHGEKGVDKTMQVFERAFRKALLPLDCKRESQTLAQNFGGSNEAALRSRRSPRMRIMMVSGTTEPEKHGVENKLCCRRQDRVPEPRVAGPSILC